LLALASKSLRKRLRRRLRRAGLTCNDQVFGIAWSGAMSEARVLALLPHLPQGVSELYCHPATDNDDLAALLSPAVRQRIAELGVGLVSYADLAPGRAMPAG